jgi:hypothetical protein
MIAAPWPGDPESGDFRLCGAWSNADLLARQAGGNFNSVSGSFSVRFFAAIYFQQDR